MVCISLSVCTLPASPGAGLQILTSRLSTRKSRMVQPPRGGTFHPFRHSIGMGVPPLSHSSRLTWSIFTDPHFAPEHPKISNGAAPSWRDLPPFRVLHRYTYTFLFPPLWFDLLVLRRTSSRTPAPENREYPSSLSTRSLDRLGAS